MLELTELIGQYDIISIVTKKDIDNFSIIFSFMWEEDFGCFSCNKDSNLTVILKESQLPSLLKDIKEKKGLVYMYILNHKQYIGELLDLEVKYD